MAVYTLEQHWLAIDQHLTVFQFYLAEAHLYRNHLCHLASSTYTHQQGV